MVENELGRPIPLNPIGTVTGGNIKLGDVLLELGHSITYKYQELREVITEFRGIREQEMAELLVTISNRSSGSEELGTRIARTCFTASLKEEHKGDAWKSLGTLCADTGADKKLVVEWNIDNLAMVFKEAYGNLNVVYILYI